MTASLGAPRLASIVALAALTAVVLAMRAEPWLAAAAGFAVLAAAWLAWRHGYAASVEAGRGSGPEAMARLSAEDFAAAVPDPLIVFDAEGATVHANAAAHHAFGALPTGSPLQLRFRAPEMQALFRSVLSDREGSAQADYAEKVPFERLYRASITPAGGESGFYVLGFRDQSEARRIDRMRADFIANASHELRTPLASISGFIETLRGPARDDAAAREKFLQIMQNQTARMARLIDDLLSLSRLEMKPFASPEEKVDLVLLLDAVIDTMKQLAADSGVVLERKFEASVVAVAGQRDELFQVFENLLENACKYGQSGGRVAIELVMEADAPRVTVRDFGPGIPAEHIPRITERFYRVDVETSRAQKGTGLGLSIVKHILTRHRAWLTIASELGNGAAFTVHFPHRGR